MSIYYIDELNPVFPNPLFSDSQGIIGIGGNLHSETLLNAYQSGIFPWYNENDPIIWWSPDPRFVLFPAELKVSKSMRPYFNQKKFTVTYDRQFENVIKACQRVERMGQKGTWITNEMLDAYVNLHQLGYAHSIEVWEGDQLAGGLYGLALGKVFYGESMFSLRPNASKFGFISLVRNLRELDFELIDCQQETAHLASLGAKAIDRGMFCEILHENRINKISRGHWEYPLKKR